MSASRRYLIYPHKRYRDRYLVDYQFDGTHFDLTEKITLTHFSLQGLFDLFNRLRALPSNTLLEVHTSMCAPLALSISRLLSLRAIYVCHGSLCMSRNPLHRSLGLLLEAINCGLADCVCLVSPLIQQYFPKSAKVRSLARPGIFRYDHFPALPFPDRLPQALRIGFVGRNTARKGIVKFVHLARDCADLHYASFHTFGFEQSYPHVFNHGFVHAKRTIYSNLDIVLVLSDFEGFCDVAAEALCYGVPVFHDGVPGLEWLPERAEVAFGTDNTWLNDLIARYDDHLISAFTRTRDELVNYAADARLRDFATKTEPQTI